MKIPTVVKISMTGLAIGVMTGSVWAGPSLEMHTSSLKTQPSFSGTVLHKSPFAQDGLSETGQWLIAKGGKGNGGRGNGGQGDGSGDGAGRGGNGSGDGTGRGGNGSGDGTGRGGNGPGDGTGNGGNGPKDGTGPRGQAGTCVNS